MEGFANEDPRSWQRSGLTRRVPPVRASRSIVEKTALRQVLLGVAAVVCMASWMESAPRQEGPGEARAEVYAPYIEGWNEVRTPQGIFHLSRPIRVQLTVDGALWVAWCEEFQILGHGESPPRAIQSFGEEFVAVWDGLADVPDADLTRDAQELRQQLVDLVQAIG